VGETAVDHPNQHLGQVDRSTDSPRGHQADLDAGEPPKGDFGRAQQAQLVELIASQR
jgi:hypothetical protein